MISIKKRKVALSLVMFFMFFFLATINKVEAEDVVQIEKVIENITIDELGNYVYNYNDGSELVKKLPEEALAVSVEQVDGTWYLKDTDGRDYIVGGKSISYDDIEGKPLAEVNILDNDFVSLVKIDESQNMYYFLNEEFNEFQTTMTISETGVILEDIAASVITEYGLDSQGKLEIVNTSSLESPGNAEAQPTSAPPKPMSAAPQPMSAAPQPAAAPQPVAAAAPVTETTTSAIVSGKLVVTTKSLDGKIIKKYYYSGTTTRTNLMRYTIDDLTKNRIFKDYRYEYIKGNKTTKSLVINYYNSYKKLSVKVEYYYQNGKKWLYYKTNYDNNGYIKNKAKFCYDAQGRFYSYFYYTNHKSSNVAYSFYSIMFKSGKAYKNYTKLINSSGKTVFQRYQHLNTHDGRIRGVNTIWRTSKGVIYKQIAYTNVTYYNQRDSRWGWLPAYPGGRFNNTACYLTAFSIVNSAYNTPSTPLQIYNSGVNALYDVHRGTVIYGNTRLEKAKQVYEYPLAYNARQVSGGNNIWARFENKNQAIPNGKSTFNMKEAIADAGRPLLLWTYPSTRRTGHGIVPYKYTYINGKYDIIAYDPYTYKRSLVPYFSYRAINHVGVWYK